MALRAVLGTMLAVLSCALPSFVHADNSAARTETLQQVAGILDYIGGDYRGAVGPGGEVLSATEYAEQRSFARDAAALLRKVGIAAQDPLLQRLNELTQALDARRDPAEIEQLCRRARETIVRDHQVDLAPNDVPSRSVAERLYRAQACNTCHADDGSANTPVAAGLDPRPANFLDAERVASVSPHRAFHAIMFGVPGTAMTAYTALSEAERWSLAFYVLSLRHLNADFAGGKAVLDRLPTAAASDARALSQLSEEELLAQLSSVRDSKQRAAALAYLRAEAPFMQAAKGTDMTVAYRQLQSGLRLYAAGDREGARRAFIAAYLDGVEPHEAGLRARDAALVQELETAMLELRAAAAEGMPQPQLETAVDRARQLLDRAQRGRADAGAAFLGALTIALREGVEIVLLVAALLGLVRKRGQPALARYVHAGWLLAIPAGLLTYYAAESVLSGMQRELAEGLASLLAAAVLLGVTHWLLGQLGSKHWVGFLAKGMGAAISGRRAAAGVLALSFVAAYREAFEIVLFFEALVRDAGTMRDVWLGAAIGVGLLCVFALLLLRVGQRLRPAPFMLASSVCLAVLCFVLLGKGIHALQEAAVIPLHPVAWPSLPWLGMYASREGLIAQGALTLALIASALLPKWRARRSTPPTNEAPAE